MIWNGVLGAVDEPGLAEECYGFIETQDSADYRPNIDSFVNEGFGIIVTSGFAMGSATHQAGIDLPGVFFIGTDQGQVDADFAPEPLDNVAGLIFHEYISGFLAGALATVDYGAALGVIRAAHEQGKQVHVLVDETRPRLQGAKLTAWELEQYGVPYEIISDNAAGYFLSRGHVAGCFVGADRVAANGDVANKIGTYMLALAAHDSEVPFYAVVPTSTIDLSLPSGADIPIEERDIGRSA